MEDQLTDSKADSSTAQDAQNDSKADSSSAKHPNEESLIGENKRQAEKIGELKTLVSQLKAQLDQNTIKSTPPKKDATSDDIDYKLGIVSENMAIQNANQYLEDKADELGMDVEDLAKKLKPFYEYDENKTRIQNNRAAFKKYQEHVKEQNEIKEKLEKARKELEETQRFRETGSRVPRDQNKENEWKEAKTVERKTDLLVDLIG